MQVGQTVPVGMMSSGYVSPNPTSTSAWIADTSLTTVTDKIWLPNLPTHGLSPRTPLGWQMPPEFLPDGVAECTVYFPGTYPNPVTIDGPTYFASGIYYFEDTVLISGGADVVVGSGGGDDEGCTNDQHAAFYAVDAPSTHNINGLGATFVLGKSGRLVVDNAGGGPIKLQFNKRYVAAGDVGGRPSAGVSILSVNGKLARRRDHGWASVDPERARSSAVERGCPDPAGGGDDAEVPAVGARSHRPSQRCRIAPTGVVATGYTNSMQVSWTAPVNNGGAKIDEYTVRVASPAGNTATCGTVSATMCVVTGLLPLTNYTFTVEATNARGTSAFSAPSAVKQTGALPPPAWVPGDPLPDLPGQIPILDFALDRPRPQWMFRFPATCPSPRAGSGCRTRTLSPS